MSQFKGTPGPWEVVDDTPWQLWVKCHDGKNPLHESRLHRERLANAQLYAAAPELLAATQAIVNFWNRISSDGSPINELHAAALSAIAKATGEKA